MISDYEFILNALQLAHAKLLSLNTRGAAKEQAIALQKIDEAQICVELLIKKEGEKTHV